MASRDLQRLASRLTMRHLRMVMAVAEDGSLVAAGRHLNMTQSAITKALQEVEHLLGVPLFERTNRGVRPTIYGQTLAGHARVVSAQFMRAAQHISDLHDGVGGRVCVGTLLSGSAEILPSAIIALRRERPMLAVDIVDGTNDRLLPGLRNGVIELIVGRLPDLIDRRGLVVEPLLDDNAYLAARPGHPLARHAQIELADLVDHDWIMPPGDTTLRRQIDRAFTQAGCAHPARVVTSVCHLTNRRLVADADYLVIWPGTVARQEVAQGNVVLLPITFGPHRDAVGITYQADRALSEGARALANEIRKTCAVMEYDFDLLGMNRNHISNNNKALKVVVS